MVTLSWVCKQQMTAEDIFLICGQYFHVILLKVQFLHILLAWYWTEILCMVKQREI